ncbi:MAG: LemA family protein [Lachnospiraceae bacterium]|nr:LemA family protein [Lachnospiraceae bacterium]
MSALMVVLVVLAAIAFLFVSWMITTSNNINRIKIKIEESLSGVEIMLRQRYDVLMQGKKIAEQYAQHEKSVFEGLRNLSSVPSNASIDDLNRISENQEKAVKNLFALGEAYPELKSAEIFSNLLNKLSDLTQQYSASRRAVNGNITKLNNYVVTFPSSVICGMKSVSKMDYIHEENMDQLKNVDLTMNL